MRGAVTCLVGGQFGSEGKGLIAGEIARDYKHHVRVGAANAGHTLYTPDPQPSESQVHPEAQWEKHVMQQIPCAAYANPDASLYVGPGALISPDIFEQELLHWSLWRESRGLPEAVVTVDPRAHVIQDEHVEREQATDLAERIGSTSTIAKEGIGVAQAARVLREAGCVLAKDYFRPTGHWDQLLRIKDVPEALWDKAALLEGTQGADLSLATGAFPYVTSRNTTAAGLCADVGIAPTDVSRVVMVVRSYPIRVAGPSGPFWPDSAEITWDMINVDPESERTTVTRKVRRVATLSLDQVAYAARLNGATEIALTFADYLDPEIYGQAGAKAGWDLKKYPVVHELRGAIESVTHKPVRYIGTGPHSVIRL